MTINRKTLAVIVALLLIGLGLYFVAYSRSRDQKLTDALIESCKRVNILRREENDRARAIRSYANTEIAINNEIIYDITVGIKPTKAAIKRNATLIHLRDSYHNIKIVNCERVVRRSV